MSTIDMKEIADTIIANNGGFEDDQTCIAIVAYNNQFDGRLVYGLCYHATDVSRYMLSVACKNPTVIFRHDPTKPVSRTGLNGSYIGAEDIDD